MSEFFQQFIAARGTRTRRSFEGTLAQATLGLLMAAGIAGCGSNLKPTTTPIIPTGPAPQPQSYAFVISSPSPSAQGIGTVIDYSGDTISASAQIGPGPSTFTLWGTGSEAWTLNSDGTISNIPVSSNLQNKLVTYSTLNPLPPNGVNPIVQLFSGSVGLFALDATANQLDVLTGSPDAFKLQLPVDPTPVTMAGVAAASRYYSVSQVIPYGTDCNTNPHGQTQAGVADGIETTPNYAVSAQIPVGVCPVYALGTTDAKRVFVLNRGSDTITVINSQTNGLDQCTCPPTGCLNQSGVAYTCHPTIPLSTAAVSATGIQPVSGSSSLLPTAGPVYAEYNAATEQLAVANYDGNSISIIDVKLDQYGNDGPTFGTTFTVPVGYNPASVTILADGSRAYVANQSGDAVNGTANGSVSIVNMSSHKIQSNTPIAVQGHPRTVVSTAVISPPNSIDGKVYVASPDSPYITIIRTDQDIISTAVLVQGNVLDVRTQSPDTTSSNLNIVSRIPGAGQPCYLPPSAFTAAGAAVTIHNCQVQDPSLFQ